jgi:hypothetical protein
MVILRKWIPELQPFNKIPRKESFLQQKTEINKSQIIISYAEHAVKSLVMQKNLQVISFLQHLKIQMCVGCVKNL